MTVRKYFVAVAALPIALLPLAAPAQAGIVGEDSALCANGKGPAIQANIVGLKDRAGEVKLEIYPANENDFLRDDHLLIQEHKVFRRVTARTPQSGPVEMCIKVPAPGRYALLFTHNRDSKSKFDFWTDGAGFPSNLRMGRSKPKLNQAIIDVGPGITTTSIRAQYLRGLGGFGPMKE
ncbi:MAG: DUF2141 domain-containing protein [Sphingomonas sp.]|jgi:uncharacterized protein (DUF2141 family)|uniref:DUF2141 domain-containing protein n=1 Tax=Sphingomonas sp. TaxID=28214 RepID=UPI003563FDB5